jgi:hypothetical protein
VESVEGQEDLRYESILPLMDRLHGSGQPFLEAAEIVAQIEDSFKRANGTQS